MTLITSHSTFLLFSFFALMLGMRHALDADHIVAIDNMTRKFYVESKNSTLTGLYFAVGHSSVVFMLTLTILIGVTHFHQLPASLTDVGEIIGGSISAIFLLLSAYITLTALKNPHQHAKTGVLSWTCIKLFNKINRPKKMIFIGFLFGLGFDTASQISLLSILNSPLVLCSRFHASN